MDNNALDEALRLAHCAHCDHAFSFDDDVPLAVPDELEFEGTPDGMLVRFRWMGPKVWVLAAFSALWDLGLVFWFASPASGPGLFAAAHLVVGAALTYAVVAGMANTTSLCVSGGSLAVRHGPVPWPGNVAVRAADVGQLCCRRVLTQTRTGSPRVRYALEARLCRKPPVVLLDDIEDLARARFLEGTLERALGVRNRPVAGEA